VSEKNSPITLAQVIEQPYEDGGKNFINGVLTVAISHVEEKSGQKGPFFVAKLSDPDNPGITMRGTFFGRKAFPFEGHIVKISGAIVRGEYNNVAEFKAFGRYLINSVGKAGGSSAPPAGGGSAPPAGKSKDTYGAGAMGQRIGNALTNACHLIGQTFSADEDPAYLLSKKFAQDVWITASWIMRAGDRLEAGQLAKFDKDGNLLPVTAAPAPAKPPEPPPPEKKPEPAPPPTGADRKNPPTHDGSAFGNRPNPSDMEDVPF
jgi:hypothetical protein